MRRVRWLACVGLGLVLAAMSAGAGATALYDFEALTQTRHDVPARIATALREANRQPLQDCQQQLGASDAQMLGYFTATPVVLPDTKATALLVLPTRSCYAFYGAHAISFWLFLQEGEGEPRLVLTGRRDALEVKAERSGGLPEISTYYGTSELRYRYDGERYLSPDD